MGVNMGSGSNGDVEVAFIDVDNGSKGDLGADSSDLATSSAQKAWR